MTKHSALSVIVTMSLLAACGDDSGGGGAGTTGAGTGGGAGTTGAGTSGGGTSGGGTSGGGTGSPAEQVLACMMMGMGGSGATDCTGIEEYTQCTQSMCGIADCMDNECKDYFACVIGASDPCTNNCMLVEPCTGCITNAGLCAASMCLDKLQCGDKMSGGACDQLEACCAKQEGPAKLACDLAGAVSVGGDTACEMVLPSLCP